MISANKGSGICWLLECGDSNKDLTDDELLKYCALIENTFISNKDLLNYEACPRNGLLMQDKDLFLGFGKDENLSFGKADNQIDRQCLTGAGSLYGAHAKHLIMLALLAKNAASEGLNINLSVCDSFGSLLEYDSIPELINLLEPLGFNKDELRQFAEAVGLCEKAIDLSTLNIAEQEDYFF